MKKLLMMFLGLVVFSSTVLADDDKPISIAQMPKQAQQFIAEYFPGIQVSFATQEGKAARSYDVLLMAIKLNLTGTAHGPMWSASTHPYQTG